MQLPWIVANGERTMMTFLRWLAARICFLKSKGDQIMEVWLSSWEPEIPCELGSWIRRRNLFNPIFFFELVEGADINTKCLFVLTSCRYGSYNDLVFKLHLAIIKAFVFLTVFPLPYGDTFGKNNFFHSYLILEGFLTHGGDNKYLTRCCRANVES